MIGIIPAAGDAIRMGGIPKFLLPINNEFKNLITWHIESQLKYCEKVVVITKPKYKNKLNSFITNKNVSIVYMETLSMSETVLNAIKLFPSKEYLFGMPDTFCIGDNPYDKIMEDNKPCDINLAIWKIKKYQKGKLGQIKINKHHEVVDCIDKDLSCNYEYSWGMMRFSHNVSNLIEINTPHIGFMINPSIENGLNVIANVIDGEYFDCGTTKEYDQLLKKMNRV
jgi:hypothetical protein